MNARFRDDQDIPARTPPANIEAEQNVLGVLMSHSSAFAKVQLEPEDFYLRKHRELFKALQDMEAAGSPLDPVTVGDWAESRGIGEAVGGGAYLVELASLSWTASNLRAYAGIVRDRSRLRRVVDLATELLAEAFQPNGRSAAEIVDAAVGDLMKLNQLESNCDFSLAQAIKLAWKDAEIAYEHRGTIRGVPTGFTRMDARLGGWHKQDLIFLPARPGMGKTALMVNLGLNAAGAGHTIGLISGEQSAMQLGQRSLAVDAQVSQRGVSIDHRVQVKAESLRNGQISDDVWPLLSESMQRLAKRRLRIFDRPAPTLEEVVRTARLWKQEYGMSALYVDYLQRIRFRGVEKRHEEVAEVAQGLKTLARDLDIPVICLAQVKAEVEGRNDKRPRQGDIANSDEATREADLIAFLYRDEVYNDNTAEPGVAEINVEKNRHGPTGQFKIKFNHGSMLFEDPEDQEYLGQPASPRRARSVPVSKPRQSAKSAAAGDQS